MTNGLLIQEKPLISNERVEYALVVSLYQQARLGFLASILCCTIVLIGLFSIYPEKVMYWYACAIFIVFIRYVLVKQFFQSSSTETFIKIWRNLFTLGSFLNGLIWGCIGTPLLLPQGDNLTKTLLLVILSGIAAGSVPLLSYVRTTVIAFLTPVLLPLIIYLYTVKNDTSILLATAISIFFIYLVMLSLKTHYILKKSIQLSFSNVDLLKTLSKATFDLENSNKKLAKFATLDPLTKIGNRNLFVSDFSHAIEQANQRKTLTALLYIDIDKFKWVNDLYGHQAGDALLLTIVKRITDVPEFKQAFYRVGGDEFTVLLQHIQDPLTVADEAKKICELVANPVKIGDIEVLVNASIGISLYPIDGKDVDSLIKIADRAMYYVKKNGGNSYHFNVELEQT